MFDTISDNAANAGVISAAVRLPDEPDLRWISALLYRNGVIEETESPRACSTTWPTAWRGWPTNLPPTTFSRSQPDHSRRFVLPVRSRPAEAIPSTYYGNILHQLPLCLEITMQKRIQNGAGKPESRRLVYGWG